MSIIQEALKRAQKKPVEPKDIGAASGPSEEKQSFVSTGTNLQENTIKTGRMPKKDNYLDRLKIFLGLVITIVIFIFALSAKALIPVNSVNSPVKNSYKLAAIETPAVRDVSSLERSASVPAPKNPVELSPSFFKLPIKANPDSSRFVLSGIMYLESGPRAIINNIIVGIGDTVSGAVVRSISKRSVELEFGDSKITLSLK